MSPQIVQWTQIQVQIDRIRSTHRVRALTNCFTPLTGATNLTMFSSDNAVVFSCPDTEFSRLYFHASDVASLAHLLANLQSPFPLVLGYVDKTKNEALCAALHETGFTEIAHYIRMTCMAFPVPEAAEQPKFATVEETVAIMNLLRYNFNPVTDHLPSHELLYSMIEQQQVIVHREAGQISGLVAFQVLGRQVNFNYLLNYGLPGSGSILMQSFFLCMSQRGHTSGFLWVASMNKRARRIYIANGWKADGLNDWFYTRNATSVHFMDQILDILSKIRPEVDYHGSADYLADGLLDSFDIVTLVSDLDASFKICILGAEITPDNFRNAESITKLVNRHTNAL